jgi:hypothetical protein
MAKGAYYCEVTYQGLPCVQAMYRRSEGLDPEGGSVLISTQHINGNLKIEVPEVPWTAVNGAEFDHGADMRTWLGFKPRVTRTADRPPSPEAKGGQLKLFGDLVMKTFELSGKLVDEIRYWAVYVDRGIEPVTEDLANALEHPEGLWRVPLTDIRRYYRGPYAAGAFYGRINCRKKNGLWDSETIGGGPASGGSRPQPYSLSQVLEMLFAQLPGTPAIDSGSDLYDGNDDDPSGIEGKGEPVAEHIQKLLDRTGYKAQMLPDGNYAVSRKWGNRVAKRTIMSAVKKSVDVDEDVHNERVTSTPTNRPSAMVGVGPRRIQRITVGMTPVLRDPTDGRYYKLKKAFSNFGMALETANEHVFKTPEFQFRNVKPTPEDEDSDALHEERRDACKAAYCLYLPEFLFPDDESAVDLDRLDDIDPPLLPMREAAWYLRDLSGILRKIPLGAGGVGDVDDFALLPPVVRACRIGHGWFRNMDQMKRRFRAHRVAHQRTLGQFQNLLQEAQRKQKEAALELGNSETVSVRSINQVKAGRYGVKDFVELEIGADIRKAQKEVGVVMPLEERLKFTREGAILKRTFEYWSKIGKHWSERIQKENEAFSKIEGQFEEFESTYKDREALSCRYNLPQSVISSANVDRSTGLVKSPVPLCQVDQPFFFDGDEMVVVNDGNVTVTYGYELKGPYLQAATAFVFMADDGGDPDKRASVKYAGECRSTPLKCPMVPIESRMYLEDNGMPLNQNACWSEAKTKVSGTLAQPRRVTGWTIEVVGLRKAVLDGGVNTVQHEFDGAVGMTHVSVNAPGAAMPLLPANAVGQRPYPMAQWRDDLQREREFGD